MSGNLNYGSRKKVFLQMHNTILQKAKKFLNLKMKNLEQIK